MELEHIKIGQYVFVNKVGSSYDGEEGRVLSIFSDYGLDSRVVSIKLLLDDGAIIGGFKAEEISP